MKKGIILAVGFLTFIVALSFIASALVASISNPRMILYHNITDGGTLQFENSVIANNDNNYSVSITITPIDVWENKIVISEPEFILKSGERKQVNYTITIDEPGYYRGNILVNFHDSQSPNTLSAAQDLVVLVADESGKVPEKAEDKEMSLTIPIIVIVVLVLIVAILVIGRKK